CLAAIFFGLGRLVPDLALFFGTTAGLNALLGISNLLPIRFRVGKVTLLSDGALILQALLHGEPENSYANLLQMLRTFRGLWREIGDTTTLYLFSWIAAWA